MQRFAMTSVKAAAAWGCGDTIPRMLRILVFLLCATAVSVTSSSAQPEHPGNAAVLPDEPESVVRGLYAAVLAYHPRGIPADSEMKTFAPYLSKALLRRIDSARACDADWDRLHPDPGLITPGRGYGLFSGDNPSPQAFAIEKTDAEKDGSFRVHVSLRFEMPPAPPWYDHPVLILVREDGHFAVDDVTYPQIEYEDPRPPLSEYLSAGCIGPHWIGFGGRQNGANDPEALTRDLYRQVVARRSIAIPRGTDLKIFSPYLSNALLHKLDLAADCQTDWARQFPDPNLKPPFMEGGIFSGGDDEDQMRSFEIEKTERQNDGSFRVYVNLTYGKPPEKPWISRRAAIVVEENGHLVVDDVVFLRDQSRPDDVDMRVSEIISEGCDGPLWVGEQRTAPKQHH